MTIGLWRRIPADPTTYFDAEQVAKGKEYNHPKKRAKMASSLASTITLIALIWTGAGPGLLERWDPGPWPLEMIWVLIATLSIVGIPGTPLDVWVEFVHERKWGFSTRTVKDYIVEDIKQLFIVGGLILPAILIPIFALIRWTSLWWLISGLAVTAVGLFLSFLYPIVILPMSNKFTPLEDEELNARLHATAERAGVPVSAFLVMDASKRTKKDNAFFAGIGATKRVVLFDNILELPPECIEVVVAHELGHWRRRHTVFGALESVFVIPVVLGLTALIGSQQAVLDWAEVSSLGDAGAVPLFLLLMGGIQQVLSRLTSISSRAYERAADVDALELTGDPEAVKETWRRMVDRNLPDVDPPWWERTKMSHPPIAERLAHADRWFAATAEAEN